MTSSSHAYATFEEWNEAYWKETDGFRVADSILLRACWAAARQGADSDYARAVQLQDQYFNEAADAEQDRDRHAASVEIAREALLKIARAYPEETGSAAGRIARSALDALDSNEV